MATVTVEKPTSSTPAKAGRKRMKADAAPAAEKTKPAAEKTASKKKESKQDGEKKKKEKTNKKINVKPTTADVSGLNLSVAKVKNVVANLCINREAFHALGDVKSVAMKDGKLVDNFKSSQLSKETIETISKFWKKHFEEEDLAFTKGALKKFSAEKLKEYNAAKRKAQAGFFAEKKRDHLFDESQHFNVHKFNVSFDKHFYKDAKFTEDWKKLEGKELYENICDVISKNKIRFNSEAKIYITALVEYIIKQLITNSIQVCVNEKKKIVQPKHAFDVSNEKLSGDFPMFAFISRLDVYKKWAETEQAEAETPATPESMEEHEDEKSIHFKYYIGELCRTVRTELSANDTSVDDPLMSQYNSTSVSKNLKEFCSDAIIEMLYMFGQHLREEVYTRDIKTVNHILIEILVRSLHIFYKLDATPTIDFIREKANMFIDHQAEKREQKKKSSA